MNARIPLLAGLFAVQLLLAVLVSFGGDGAEHGSGLLTLTPAEVTRLEITDAEGASVAMTRDPDGWRLEEGVRADNGKIAEVLDKLAATAGLWPVAATASSQARFEVAEDNYQRRVDLDVNGEALRLFFGTSPGYRRVHVRRDGADEVFSVALANYELPATSGDWLDKTQLATDSASSITLEGAWTLAKGPEGWLLDGAAADPEAAQRLADRLDGLRVLDSYTGSEEGLDEPRRLRVQDADGELELVVRHRSGEDDYVLTSSRLPGAYTVAAYIVEQLVVDAGALLPPVEEPAADAGDAADGGGDGSDAAPDGAAQGS